MIELKRITKTFFKTNGQVTALSDVNLEVPEGKIFGVTDAQSDIVLHAHEENSTEKIKQVTREITKKKALAVDLKALANRME